MLNVEGRMLNDRSSEYPPHSLPFGLLSALRFDRAFGGPYTRRFLFRGLEE
jgi:hypothetical protein